MSNSNLEIRINKLLNIETIDGDLLKAAYSYCVNDPESSLTKSRMVFEKLLNDIYKIELGWRIRGKFRHNQISLILDDRDFKNKINERIYGKMQSIKWIANLSAHPKRFSLSKKTNS